jgi:hypothetical protein
MGAAQSANTMSVLIYLLAIVAANLSIVLLGPAWAPINAFLFIGLDFTLRDKLHDRWATAVEHHWSEENAYSRFSGAWIAPAPVFVKMGLLVAAGGLISYALNADAGQIAVASSVAFAIAASLDAVVYHLLRKKDWYTRANGSNVAGSAADSILFPTLAFGSFMPLVILAQFVAKVFGGALWALLLKRWRVAAVACVLLIAAPAVAQPIIVSAHYDIGRDTPIVSATYGQVLPFGLYAAGFAEVWYNHSRQYPASRWVLFSKHWISRRIVGRLSASVEIEVIKNRAGVDFRAFDIWGGGRKVYVAPKVGLSYRLRK